MSPTIAGNQLEIIYRLVRIPRTHWMVENIVSHVVWCQICKILRLGKLNPNIHFISATINPQKHRFHIFNSFGPHVVVPPEQYTSTSYNSCRLPANKSFKYILSKWTPINLILFCNPSKTDINYIPLSGSGLGRANLLFILQTFLQYAIENKF